MTTSQVALNKLKKELKKDLDYMFIAKDLQEAMEAKYFICNTKIKYGMTIMELFNNWIAIIVDDYDLTIEETREVTLKATKWIKNIIANS